MTTYLCSTTDTSFSHDDTTRSNRWFFLLFLRVTVTEVIMLVVSVAFLFEYTSTGILLLFLVAFGLFATQCSVFLGYVEEQAPLCLSPDIVHVLKTNAT